jgi:hypothetical protein
MESRPKLKYHARESAQKEVAKYRDLYKDLTVDNWRELLSQDEDSWDNMEREEWKVLEEQVLLPRRPDNVILLSILIIISRRPSLPKNHMRVTRRRDCGAQCHVQIAADI